MSALKPLATIWEGNGAVCMARIQDYDATNVLQADVSSISRKIFNVSNDPTTAISTTAPSKTSVIFDTLQTDARWTVDSTGYNFRDTIEATNMPDGPAVYRIEYTFTMAAGQPIRIVFEIETLNTFTD